MSDDWSMAEVVRNILRIDRRVDELSRTTITESAYERAQKTTGERIEEMGRRITTIETRRESEGESRAAEWRRNTWVVIAAGIAFFGSLALAVLQLVAK